MKRPNTPLCNAGRAPELGRRVGMCAAPLDASLDCSITPREGWALDLGAALFPFRVARSSSHLHYSGVSASRPRAPSLLAFGSSWPELNGTAA